MARFTDRTWIVVCVRCFFFLRLILFFLCWDLLAYFILIPVSFQYMCFACSNILGSFCNSCIEGVFFKPSALFFRTAYLPLSLFYVLNWTNYELLWLEGSKSKQAPDGGTGLSHLTNLDHAVKCKFYASCTACHPNFFLSRCIVGMGKVTYVYAYL